MDELNNMMKWTKLLFKYIYSINILLLHSFLHNKKNGAIIVPLNSGIVTTVNGNLWQQREENLQYQLTH